jgi:pimeloyl-ACP methyl ester carboxylesterase
MSPTPPEALRALIDRYNPRAFELGRPQARVRLAGAGPHQFDALLDGHTATLVPVHRGDGADAVLRADVATWEYIATDVRGGMGAFRRGALQIRKDLHLGVGFLAATAAQGEGSLRFRWVHTARGNISVCEAGTGPVVLAVHGLGGTKASFLPTVAALAPSHRVVAADLPGFGDSDKPIRARYDAAFFSDSMVALLDALGVEEADVIGNSMGGRVALEMGLSARDRVRRLVLLAPSLAWLRDRPWAAPLRLVAPQLGLIQPAPRPVVERIVRQVVPGADTNWTSAGIDEFLRAYLTPRGRAAFYAAARNIYLENPHGPNGFWTRLPELRTDSLFVWGKRDPLVPVSFARHVRAALPNARHLELRCGHVPQLEAPGETHRAILDFLGA